MTTKPAAMIGTMPLTIDEVKAHPGFPTAIVPKEPESKGFAPVGKGRGGPINIAYEIHGHGPTKLVFVMGLNGPKIAWYRQVNYFGHDRADQYTVLIYDNRGVGDSDTPLVRYTTTDMAKDLLELCDHLGWQEKFQLNLVGVSMGGMIAQEFAYMAPGRLCSLTLQSTAAGLTTTLPWYKHLAGRIYMIMPKPLSARLEASKYRLFSKEWVNRPDDLGVFPTNGDRYTAEELWRIANLRQPRYQGYLLQGLAASWHNMNQERLKTIGGSVKHIQVMTGIEDNMIEHFHTDIIVEGLETAGREVKKLKFAGAGHCLHWEVREYNEVIEKFVLAAQQDARGGQ